MITGLRTLASEQQIRLAIQGSPCSGKTYSALTFPNPVVANFDNGLTAHAHRKDLLELPMYSPEFVDALVIRKNPQHPPNRRDAFKKWLRAEGTKLDKSQTFIIDSWSTLQDAFDQQTDLEPVYSKDGRIDDFAFWALKIDYSRDIMELLGSLKCHVVVIFHESAVRDAKSGMLLDKIQPLMQGKFVAKLSTYFTDFFRQHCIGSKDEKGLARQINGVNVVEPCDWYWQIRSDEKANCKTRMSRAETLIKANFSEFNYSKTIST